ncbi:GGDEF domain-containing protein [Xenophilus arseniciresistens]|uniref:diguanylate cyclase n=1 Tax=Xenophilus arseniciresistens TaxID=1283306 RepID=A0AAE3SZJ0_9BURK|nr:GGDEF domain-containing protein [Xenophilus arseniciresistens]MDA7415926.1 GGDEF domain-containing protein [Xenophilus arseniciresistens]
MSTMAGLMSLVIGALLLGLPGRYAARIPGLRAWGCALLMYALGTASYLLNHVLPTGLATMPGNALVMFGFALLMAGSRRFLGCPKAPGPMLWLCCISLGVIAFFQFVVPDYRVRISVFTGTLAFIALAHLRLLLRHGQGWASRFMAGVLGCLSLVMGVRGVLTWWVDRPDMHIYMPSSVQGAYVASYAFAVLLLGVGVLFMATERVRVEFEHMATHDGLTHALTRRSWMSRAEAALADPGRPLVAVLMLDLDHFKRINDAQGHQAGDRVLATLARVMADALPPGAALGRYGGEEFVILLEGHAAAQALEVAERLRQAVQARALGCTVSIGLALAGPTQSPQTPLDALIQRADRALYRAKGQGRNQVQQAGPAERDAAPSPLQAAPQSRP